jgi:hypothetical protein
MNRDHDPVGGVIADPTSAMKPSVASGSKGLLSQWIPPMKLAFDPAVARINWPLGKRTRKSCF